jgi:hypothetical protein
MFRERGIGNEFGGRRMVHFLQQRKAGLINGRHSTQVESQFLRGVGRPQLRPSSPEFGYPRPDDFSFELHDQSLRLFLDGHAKRKAPSTSV